MQIGYEISQADIGRMLIRVEADKEEVREQILDAIEEAADAAERHMMSYMAQHYESGDTFRSIKSNDIIFQPGGSGGGGYWEVELSIGEGVEYFNIFLEGSETPIRASEGNIREVSYLATTGPGTRTTTGANWMELPPKGSYKLFHKEVSGQESHEEFITFAQQLADEIVERKLAAI